jgi:hypothetical protein
MLQYWDSITREDLEFSVGAKHNNWEVKDHVPLYDDETRNTFYGGNNNDSGMLHQPGYRASGYGGY